MIRFEAQTKYYQMSLITDLLGDFVLICDFGSKITRYHRRYNKVFLDYQAAVKHIKSLTKTRYRHGYWLVKNNSKIDLDYR